MEDDCCWYHKIRCRSMQCTTVRLMNTCARGFIYSVGSVTWMNSAWHVAWACTQFSCDDVWCAMAVYTIIAKMVWFVPSVMLLRFCWLRLFTIELILPWQHNRLWHTSRSTILSESHGLSRALYQNDSARPEHGKGARTGHWWIMVMYSIESRR